MIKCGKYVLLSARPAAAALTEKQRNDFFPKGVVMKKFLSDIFFTVIGSALVGISLPMFTIPNDVAPGGVSGLATALAHITPWHVSVWTLLLNVPLLIGAWNLLGKRSLVFTVISTLLVSAFIELGARFLPEYRNDVLMAAFYGGILGGAGIGMLFARGISTGGTDLLALMLKKYIPNISSGTLLMAVDLSVVVFAVCVFRNIDVALYSAVTIFVMSRVIDALTQGVDYAKVVYVVTARGREVADALMGQLDRGTTIVPATGGYTGENKQLIITVTRRNVLSRTLKLIRETDPDAFIYVTDSTEVHGEGFKLDLPE